MARSPGQAAGVKTAEALVAVFNKARGVHLAQSQPVIIDTLVEAMRLYNEGSEAEVAPMTEGILSALADHEGTPPELRKIAADLAVPQHQVGNTILTTFVGTLLGYGLASILAPFANNLQQQFWKLDPSAALSPSEVGLALVKGEMSEDEAKAEARLSGINGGRFDTLAKIIGNAPGTQELLFAYRRGIIDEGRLEHGIKQGQLRNEWIDVIKALRFAPMSIGEAIQGAVQSHLSEDEARKITEQNGLTPEHFQPLLEIAGNPPGPQTVLDLMDRGLMSQAEAIQALKESSLKNKYIPLLLESAVWLPPVRTVVAMVHRGSIDNERAVELLAKNGVEPDLAQALIAEGSATKTEKDRDLSITTVRELYEDRAITRENAMEFLAALGYDEHEAGFLLAIGDLRRARRMTDHAVSKVRALYVAHKITETDATNALDRLQILPEQRDEMIDSWTIERETNVKTLTQPQVLAAVKKGIIEPQAGFDKLVQMGYLEDDAGILMALANVAPAEG